MNKKIIYFGITLIVLGVFLIILHESAATDESMITISSIINDYDTQKAILNSSVTIDATDEDFNNVKDILNKYSDDLNRIEFKINEDNNYVIVYPNSDNGNITCTIYTAKQLSDEEGSDLSYIKQLNDLACYKTTSSTYSYHIQDYITSILRDEDKNNSTYNILLSYLNMKMMAELFCYKRNDAYVIPFIQNKGTVTDPVTYRSDAKDVTARVHTLLFMYKVTDNNVYANRYAERLKSEILYICNWENEWISSQYLDTAEIVYDVGIAYDYLYDKLNEDDQRIIEKSLIRSMFLYSNYNKTLSDFINASNNWNTVCNPGTGIGAIALMRNNYRIYVSNGKSITFLGIDFNNDGIIDYTSSKDGYNSYPYIISTIKHDETFKVKDVYQVLKEEDEKRDGGNKILKTDSNNQSYIELKDLCAVIIKTTLISLPLSIDDISLDGGEREGLGYYGFIRFFVYYLSSLENSFGKVYNLLDIQTEKMNNYMLTPIYASDNKGEKYSYSDTSVGDNVAGIKYTTWLNNYYAYNKKIDSNESIITDSVKLIYDWRRKHFSIWDFTGLISYDSSFDEPIDDYSFYDYVFENTVYKAILDNMDTNQDNMSVILTFRNSFDRNDNKGFMAAIKSGNSNGGHLHLDIASYDYEMFNFKFIREIGAAAYTTNYFNSPYYRWLYYKTRAEAHSTIVINPDMEGHVNDKGNYYIMADQWRFAHPKYTQFSYDKNSPLVIFDLTDVYNKNNNNCLDCENNQNNNIVKRGFQYADSKNAFVVQDEVNLEENGDFYSFLILNDNYGNNDSRTKVLLYLFEDEDNLDNCINRNNNDINYDSLIINDDECINKEEGRIAILQLKEDKTKIVKVILNSNQDTIENNLRFERVRQIPLNDYLISSETTPIKFKENSNSSGKYKLQIHASNAKNITSKVTYIPIFNSNDIYKIDANILSLSEWKNDDSNITILSNGTIDDEEETYNVVLDKGTCATNGTENVIATRNSSEIDPSSITLAKTTYTISGFTKLASATDATVSSTSNITSTVTTDGYYTENNGTTKLLTGTQSAWVASVSGWTDANNKWIKDSDATVYAKCGSHSAKKLPTIIKSGYTCGWTTDSSETEIMYASGGSIIPTSNVTLYGICTQDSGSIEITVKKDDEKCTTCKGYKIALYQGSTRKYEEAVGNNEIVTFTGIFAGTYDVYASKYSQDKETYVDTGIDVTVTTGVESTIVNYYTITRSEGTGTTLTTRLDSASGTSFTSNIVVLGGNKVTIYGEAVVKAGNYGIPVLKHGTIPITASGETYTVNGKETITSSGATACPEGSITTTTNQTACTPCQPSGTEGENGTTSGTGKTSCDTSCEKSNVNVWKEATWSNGNVNNVCTVATCEIGFDMSDNTCVVKTYTVTFNIDDGSSVASQTVNYGETVIRPANPTREGYYFIEWRLNDEKYEFSNPVTSNLTLVAVWKRIEVISSDILKDILESKGYTVISGFIYGFTNGETINEIRNKLDNANITITTNLSIIATGIVIKMGNESYTVVIKGDLNGDGKISALDYIGIRNYMMNIKTFNSNQAEFSAADMNNDAKISALDYIALRKMLMAE